MEYTVHIDSVKSVLPTPRVYYLITFGTHEQRKRAFTNAVIANTNLYK